MSGDETEKLQLTFARNQAVLITFDLYLMTMEDKDYLHTKLFKKNSYKAYSCVREQQFTKPFHLERPFVSRYITLELPDT
jgi:hypothetical protein